MLNVKCFEANAGMTTSSKCARHIQITCRFFSTSRANAGNDYINVPKVKADVAFCSSRIEKCGRNCLTSKLSFSKPCRSNAFRMNAEQDYISDWFNKTDSRPAKVR
jgi:hypothetical protein